MEVPLHTIQQAALTLLPAFQVPTVGFPERSSVFTCWLYVCWVFLSFLFAKNQMSQLFAPADNGAMLASIASWVFSSTKHRLLLWQGWTCPGYHRDNRGEVAVPDPFSPAVPVSGCSRRLP